MSENGVPLKWRHNAGLVGWSGPNSVNNKQASKRYIERSC